jgi:hypothetical protein
MRAFIRTLTVTAAALIAALALAIGSTLTTAVSLTATTALIMGGTGRPDPDDFPGYVPNVAQYYIYPNSACQPPDPTACDLTAVYTPETAWPLYGGPDAPTWKQSILKGTELFDEAVQAQLQALGRHDHLVLFGYSQSGAILAFQKETLAGLSDEEKAQIEFVAIGNVSRPNGGLNTRLLDFSFPIVEFPYGPAMPTDTGIKTTDIAMKWDIIADAPLYVTNPLAMLNAILGFEYVHGTYPYPTAATPDGTPGGYTTEQWQWLMDHPELYPDLVDVQEYGDTEYITVTPTVLPLVAPLHGIGLKPLADLMEPALRVLIEQTGYNRDIPYGATTGFRLIPIFNPVTLAVDLIRAIPQGINQMLAGLRGEPTWVVPAPSETLLDNDSDDTADAASEAVPTAQRVSTAETPAVAATGSEEPAGPADDEEATETGAPQTPLRAMERGILGSTGRVTEAQPARGSDTEDTEDSEDSDSGGAETTPDADSRDKSEKGSGSRYERKAQRAERRHADSGTDAAA